MVRGRSNRRLSIKSSLTVRPPILSIDLVLVIGQVRTNSLATEAGAVIESVSWRV